MMKYLLFSLVCSVSVAQGAELHRHIATLATERDNLLAIPIDQQRPNDSKRIDFLNEIIIWAKSDEPSYLALLKAVNSYSYPDNSLPQQLTRSVSAPSSIAAPQVATIVATPVPTTPARRYFSRRRLLSCPPSLKFPDIKEELEAGDDVFTPHHRTGDIHPSQTTRSVLHTRAVLFQLSEEDETTA